MNLEIEGKITLLVTFIQRIFPRKIAYFLNNSHNAYKNADGNLNPWKLTFWTQPVIANDEIKVSFILANKCEAKPRISSSRSLSTVTSLL